MELVLILLSSLLLTTRATAGGFNPVVDIDGNPLQAGQLYYMIHPPRRAYGGLTLVSQKGSCPLNVASTPLNNSSGDRLAFFPESGEETIQEGDTLYIMFAVPTQCPKSTVWKVDRSGIHYVTAGGTSSDSVGPHYSRFALYRAGRLSRRGYQILVCPCSQWTVGPPRPACLMGCGGALGLAAGQNEGERLVAVGTNLPLTVNFVKASNNQEPKKNFVI